ncbi:LL-diaminopimelate aminotransferase [Clostridia bacterium]|nr:LL-diaminopimelate aminotransferase [Clostridia bacterium]
MRINENFNKLRQNYLFAEVNNRVKAYEAGGKKAIRLGIGDVTLPLPQAVLDALHKATDEMGHSDTFKGYAEYEGYGFLRRAIAENDYNGRGIDIGYEEVYVSDGAKSDTANITDLFAADNAVAICDPVYPVYNDTNVLNGREIVLMPCSETNGFLPEIPDKKVDIIYLCFPNNPTGQTAPKEYLQNWVDYANKTNALLLFDSAYEAYVREEGVPRSIFELEGARTCAIEFRSFSKTAGFTGVRCAYTVIPKELTFGGFNVGQLWSRRLATKFNGVAYIIQRGAQAVYSDLGKAQIAKNIDYYMNNAKLIREALNKLGLPTYGGKNAPYIWFKSSRPSWDTFDTFLNDAGVVTTPGVGFGACGENYIRMTSFGSLENTMEAIERLASVKI